MHKDSEDIKPVVRFKGLQCTKNKLRDQGHRFSGARVITKSRFVKRAKHEPPYRNKGDNFNDGKTHNGTDMV